MPSGIFLPDHQPGDESVSQARGRKFRTMIALAQHLSPIVTAVVRIAPDMKAGNMQPKLLGYLTGAETDDVVLRARVPFILTRRTNGAHSRLASCAVAVLFCQYAALERRHNIREAL